MSTLSPDERLNLKKLLSEMDSEDNTAHIRKVKHSIVLRDEIRKLDTFKLKNVDMKLNDPEKYVDMCRITTPFLHNNYTDIFNRIIKDEIDLVEDGKVDQNEGSVMVGKVLKELYVDSALQHAEHLDQPLDQSLDQQIPVTEKPIETKPISWKEYKKTKGM